MNNISDNQTTDQDSNTQYASGIPIRNIWLLLLYASKLLRLLNKSQKIEAEKKPDQLADLLAELLINIVAKKLKRNLTFGYQIKHATLSRVRGRINFLYTKQRHLHKRGLIACTYEELTVDTPRNRLALSALSALAKITTTTKLQQSCKTLAGRLRALGVSDEKSINKRMQTQRFGYHDADDQRMIAIANLALNLWLPTQTDGKNLMYMPERNDVKFRKLFEKAVAGFYTITLSDWRTHPGKYLSWKGYNSTAGIEHFMPKMQTDIILNHKQNKRKIVIDTKFTSVVTTNQHGKERLKSAYIYQMYAYLRTQEDGTPYQDYAAGILLHPVVDKMLNETITIQGHPIRFATVNLVAESKEIRQQLVDIIKFPESSWATI